MSLYEIPLWRRFVKLDPQTMHSKVACLHIDEVGLFIHYDKDEQLSPAYIRKHLIMIERTRCFIEASNVDEAIKIFFDEYQGSLVGGSREETRALWIDTREKILELPFCLIMHKNKRGEFVCGEEIGKNGNGEFGMCILEGYDAPDNCPIAEFYREKHDIVG